MVGNLVGRKGSWSKHVYVREGRTIFEFGDSEYVTDPKSRESYFDFIDKYQDLSPYQKELAKSDALLPEITGTWTYFCTPTAPNKYWPFYTPKTYAANGDLQQLGEKILARAAAKMLAEPQKQPPSEQSTPKLTKEEKEMLELLDKLENERKGGTK